MVEPIRFGKLLELGRAVLWAIVRNENLRDSVLRKKVFKRIYDALRSLVFESFDLYPTRIVVHHYHLSFYHGSEINRYQVSAMVY